ncbi:MAG: hypothetical protein ACTHLH_01485 [Solirubrobacterales bacterium]
MNKKLMMACTAVAAFVALIVVPTASAAMLTEVTNTMVVDTVPAGTWVTGKTTAPSKFTASGFNVECSNGELNGKVTQNAEGEAKGEIAVGGATFTGTGTSGDCTSALGSTKVTVNSKLCLAASKSADTVSITGCGANVTFTLEITGTGPCKYSTASVGGTLMTTKSPVTVSEQEAKKEEGGIFCPSSGKLDIELDLYTTGGTQILFWS